MFWGYRPLLQGQTYTMFSSFCFKKGQRGHDCRWFPHMHRCCQQSQVAKSVFPVSTTTWGAGSYQVGKVNESQRRVQWPLYLLQARLALGFGKVPAVLSRRGPQYRNEAAILVRQSRESSIPLSRRASLKSMLGGTAMASPSRTPGPSTHEGAT